MKTNQAGTQLHQQEVTIYGEHAGYQFARTKWGKRRIHTAVVETEPDFGIVEWKGRTLKVTRRFPGTEIQCLRVIWYTVEEL